MNRLMEEFNQQMKEHNRLLEDSIRAESRLRKNLVEAISNEIYKDLKRRV